MDPKEILTPGLPKRKNGSDSTQFTPPSTKNVCRGPRLSVGNLQQHLEQPLDLRTRVHSPSEPTARQYRTAFLFVKPLDLSMSHISDPVAANNTRNAETTVDNSDDKTQVAIEVMKNMELETNDQFMDDLSQENFTAAVAFVERLLEVSEASNDQTASRGKRLTTPLGVDKENKSSRTTLKHYGSDEDLFLSEEGKKAYDEINEKIVADVPKDLEVLVAPPRKFVFCSSRLTESNMSKLNELCQMCGGTIVKKYREEMTHLIINLENNQIPHTIKCLFAIADNKWVVTYDWVEASIKQGVIVPESLGVGLHEVAREPYETVSSRTSRSLLFPGVKFYFTGPLKSSGPSIKNCKKLIEKLGGTVIDSQHAEDRDVIVIGDPLTDMKKIYQELYTTKGWITVSWEWILDCVLSYTVIPFDKTHLITSFKNSV